MKLNIFEKINSEVFLWYVQALAMFPGQLSFFLRKFAFSKILANCGEHVSWGFGIDLRGWKNIQIGNKFSYDRFCSIYFKNGLVKIGCNMSLNSSVTINANLEE